MTPQQEKEKYEWELSKLSRIGRKYSMTLKARATLKEAIEELFDGLGMVALAVIVTAIDIPFFVAVFVWETFTNRK